MNNLLKMERYQIFHNQFYWGGALIVFCMGFFTADTYLMEIMGPDGGAAASLADIFNGMVYDSTILLVFISSILSLILGQEFSWRTIDLEISAGHSRESIFASKIIVYLIAFNSMTLVYPIAGCLRELGRFGITDVGSFFYNVIKASLYSLLLNSAVLLIAILVCYWLKSCVKAVAVSAICIFALSLYFGYGMMLKFPVSFLPIFQIREVVRKTSLFQPDAILSGVIWGTILIALSWNTFRKCELK